MCAVFSLTRAANTETYLEQLEAPEEVNEAKLRCLQEWTEKRLDTVIITVPGKDRNFYRLHCEPNPAPSSCNRCEHLFSFPSLMNHS